MKWLNRNKIQDAKDVLDYLPVEQKTSIEIVAHKNAKQEVVEEAYKANEQLQQLLERNGFTVNIVVGAIGKPKLKQRTHNG